MLLIFPISYEFETSMSPKRVARKLDGELVEHRPSVNMLATSRFMKKYKTESIYYGRRTSQEGFQLFYHRVGKRDGGATGFYGKVEKCGKGSKIRGHFRKPIYTYVFGALWTIITLMFALMAYSLDNTAAAVCGIILMLGGLFMLFWDSGKKMLRAYLDTFPQAENGDTEG